MADNSKIEWTEATWNPVTGCSKISDGCLNCYAERLAKRLMLMGQNNYKNGFKLSLHPQSLELPLKWKKPKTIFVNSMSDLFHEDVPTSFINDIFNVMNNAYWHNFQILTKRSKRLSDLAETLNWTHNIWMGVTVESNKYINRIDHLRNVPASIKFLSLEPLLSELSNLILKNIDWVIVGGESGPNARPIKQEWIMKILKQCHNDNVPFFFKQWGGINKKKSGRMLDGHYYNEYPKFSSKIRYSCLT